jgi:hypothetical protein
LGWVVRPHSASGGCNRRSKRVREFIAVEALAAPRTVIGSIRSLRHVADISRARRYSSATPRRYAATQLADRFGGNRRLCVRLEHAYVLPRGNRGNPVRGVSRVHLR